MSSLVSLLAESGSSFFLPPAASTGTNDVDMPFYLILYISCFFFVLVIGLMAFFVAKYRWRPGGPKADLSITHHTKLEVAWSVIPLLILIVIFAIGYRGYLHMSVTPRDPIEIYVTGQKWNWSFEYPGSGAFSSGEMAVPIGRPVKLILTSRDVLHSFYVPSFRLKMDAVPNHYTTAWFEATSDSVGHTQQVYCAEYCGTSHSNMLAQILVKSPQDYERWIQEHAQVGKTPEERGAKIFSRNGCGSCHAVASPEKQPTPIIGPRLYQAFGRIEKLSNGTTVTVDETYIRSSIEDPNAQVVVGFPQGAMPVFKGRINDKEFVDLIAYIKSLK